MHDRLLQFISIIIWEDDRTHGNGRAEKDVPKVKLIFLSLAALVTILLI
jgi:hypothetical protein